MTAKIVLISWHVDATADVCCWLVSVPVLAFQSIVCAVSIGVVCTCVGMTCSIAYRCGSLELPVLLLIAFLIVARQVVGLFA